MTRMDEVNEIPRDIPATSAEVLPPQHTLRNYIRKAWMVVKWTAIVFFGSTIFVVVIFSFINPPLTPLMLKRAFIRKDNGELVGIHKHWVSFKEISPWMIRAVIASEDNRFLEHSGIDMEAVHKAAAYNKRHRRKHGASTITQQVAKNVFLWPARTWVRKGFELYFTVLIETIWSKKRIMVVYLNVLETGNGLYGVDAASGKYFHKPAAKLSQSEAALIAASLPNPRVRNPGRPSAYMLRRQARIINLMYKIGPVDL
jgi:monofunctional biosynthetic peptidoglycan transglycosylase